MTEAEKQELQLMRERENKSLQEMRKRKLSETLQEAVERNEAMRIVYRDGSASPIKVPGEDNVYAQTDGKKNCCNWNSEMGNICDDEGMLYVTTNRQLYDRIADAYGIKKDSDMWVYLSNCGELAMSWQNEQLRKVRANGYKANEVYDKEQERMRELQSKEREDRSALFAKLRGTAKEAPTPIKKTEMSQTLMNTKMADYSKQ